jgi:hypothetical protein
MNPLTLFRNALAHYQWSVNRCRDLMRLDQRFRKNKLRLDAAREEMLRWEAQCEDIFKQAATAVDDRCNCTFADHCPLGRTGISNRCTALELRNELIIRGEAQRVTTSALTTAIENLKYVHSDYDLTIEEFNHERSTAEHVENYLTRARSNERTRTNDARHDCGTEPGSVAESISVDSQASK